MGANRGPGGAIAASLSAVGSQPDVGEVDGLVLASLATEAGTPTSLATRLGQPFDAVLAALSRLLEAGLVQTDEDSVTLTPAGRRAAADVQAASPATGTAAALPAIDLGEVTRFIGSRWRTSAERAAAEERTRDELLAADTDRDSAVRQLSDAYAQGRLSASELEDRTGRALAARTYGDLDDVLQGLGGLRHPVRNHPLRKAVFFVVAFLSSPFVLVGSMLLAFGTDAGDRFGGIFFLVLFLPALFGLRRWAWPRT
jgi:DNA-binding MarR family transcriptional regulator